MPLPPRRSSPRRPPPLAALVLASGLLAACAKSGLESTCTEGAVRSCPCPSGGVGQQSCTITRTWGPCLCAPRDAGPAQDVVVVPDGICSGLALAAGCRVGRCTVNAPLDALGSRPVLRVSELPLPPELEADAISPALCDIRVLEGAPPDGLLLRLTIDLAPPIPDDALLFAVSPPSARWLPSSTRTRDGVSGFVSGEGRFGVTRAPWPFRLDAVLGFDRSSESSPAGFARNVTNANITAAFWDGARLYIGSGRRVLIYRTRRPAFGQRPDVLLGQPDLTSARAEVTASILSNVSSIWSDGRRLIVGDGARVLLWRTIPERDFTPADLVVGQRDFASNAPNVGGVSASSLNNVGQIDSDGTRLVVVDPGNHRALVWDELPSSIGQPADRVIGQSSFEGALNDESGAARLNIPIGALLGDGHVWLTSYARSVGLQRVPLGEPRINPGPDLVPLTTELRVQPDNVFRGAGLAPLPGGGLAVRVVWGAHVGAFRSAPTRAGAAFDFILGYPDLGRQLFNLPSASTMETLNPLAGGSGMLLAADGARLLVWDPPPTYTYEPARYAWGQPGGSVTLRGADYRGTSERTLAQPADVAVHGALIAVADRGNHRVLLFDRDAVLRGERAARVVLGQPDARSFTANRDRDTPGADTLSSPSGVALDGTRILVADSGNHRVLVWNSIPDANGAPADRVLGQPDFTSGRPNHGADDRSPRDGLCDTDARGLFEPVGVTTDGARVFVADRVNNRVLLWRSIPDANGAPADLVIGQDGPAGNRPNRGQGTFAPSPDGFNFPMGVTLDGESLWVADSENNRVVRVEEPSIAPRATLWIGQPDGATVSNPNASPTGTYGVGTFFGYTPTAPATITPRAVALAGDVLFVSEPAVHRIHMFSSRTGASLGVLGQRAPTEQIANAGGINAASLSLPLGISADESSLWIADAQNHRVLAHALPTPAGLSSRANILLGQERFVQNGLNQSSVARGGIVRGPRGLGGDGREVFLADTENHRVLRFAAPWTPTSAPAAVYGQPDDALALPNRGDAPGPDTLSGPRGVFVTAENVYIADTQNHRVLVFDRTSTRAIRVLGQRDFTEVRANRGGSPGASTLHSPEAVLVVDRRLYVADAGNHRVLLWNTLPTRDGQPADAALGQPDLASNAANRGASTPTARSLLFPVALWPSAAGVYVADSGNNRVLRFEQAPRGGEDLAASAVLGQPSFTERQSAIEVDQRDRLAGPVALADDGVSLFVLDRDLARVVRYPLATPDPVAASVLRLTDLGTPLVRRPSGLTVERGPYFTTSLLVSDTANDRVVRASPSPRAE
jgi:sugar lactone lactonase YvrE